MFKAMLIAGAGGFIGTCLRYLVGKLAHYVFSSPSSEYSSVWLKKLT